MYYKSAIIVFLKGRYANSRISSDSSKFYMIYQKPSNRYYYVICRINNRTREIGCGIAHLITKQKLHDTFVASDEYLHRAIPISYKYKEDVTDFVSPFLSKYPAQRFKNAYENHSMIRDFSSEQAEAIINADDINNGFDVMNVMTNTCNKNDLKPVLSDIFEQICNKTHTTT